MKKFFFKTAMLIASLCGAILNAFAQAPQGAEDVMLQGFYWDSYGSGTYGSTRWSDLLSQVDEIAASFDMVWLPPSANQEGGGGTGYHPRQWCNQNSSWGSEAELKSLISAFKDRGTRAIADIVINHRAGNTTWNDFTAEDFGTYGKFQLTSDHICGDDECVANGYKAGSKYDDGYDRLDCDGIGANGAYCAARDLAHDHEYVREACRAYLQWMKNEIGYDGWRYDLVKGFHGSHVNDYNNAAGAYFSVGEYWDGNYDVVRKWVQDAGMNTCAFDFPLKYALNNYGGSNLSALVSGYGTWAGLAGGSDMRGNAVTFVDNHDTFRDDWNKYQGNWDRAYAYILAGPGIPCVFYPHWVSCKENIKAMIRARKACGITNTSDATCSVKGSYFEGTTVGKNGTLKCYIGSNWAAPSGYTLACNGDGWAYYTSVEVPQGPTVSMSPNGGYIGMNGQVTLSATGDDVTIYYTTDGTSPNSSSSVYVSPIVITNNSTVVSAVAIDTDGNRSSIVKGTFYTEEAEALQVSFVAPSSWSGCYLYVWDADGNEVLGSWPGKRITESEGRYMYSITETNARPLNVIFNEGDGGEQTVDLSTANATCWDASGMTAGADGKVSPALCDIPEGPYNFTITISADSNPLGTSKMNIYAWDSYETITADWPGTAMTKNSNGDWTYKFSNVPTSVNVVINNGTEGNLNQSVDIIGLYQDVCVKILNTVDGSGKHNVSFVDCGGDEPSSVFDNYAHEVAIYPNPVTDVVNISSSDPIVSVVVSNIAGRVELKTSGSNINMSGLAPSLYFIEIMFEDGTKSVAKVLKK